MGNTLYVTIPSQICVELGLNSNMYMQIVKETAALYLKPMEV